MKNTYIKEFCGNYNLPLEICTCKKAENECEFCEMVDEMLELIMISNDYNERFSILRSIILESKNEGYEEGYKDCLKHQIESLEDTLEDVECEEECKCCDKNCGCCKDN